MTRELRTWRAFAGLLGEDAWVTDRSVDVK
jgi:hypothetical protein